MASIKKTPSGAFQLCIRNKLLPKTYWMTFDVREDAERYAGHLEGLLAQGVVPTALLEAKRAPLAKSWSITRCINEYLSQNSVPVSDAKLLQTMQDQLAGVSTSHVTYQWAELWIQQMKRIDNLSPSTIRHRHGALARCFDWMVRRHPSIMAVNFLRQLKRGVAQYTEEDQRRVVASGGVVKKDEERNRRLEPEEESRILTVLSRADNERVLFLLALETAMRLRECYTLSTEQISLAFFFSQHFPQVRQHGSLARELCVPEVLAYGNIE